MVGALLALGLLAAATAQASSLVKTPLQQEARSYDLVLPAPDGYCELSSAEPADRLMLAFGPTMFSNFLSMFADCDQLDAMRATGGHSLSNYAVYRTQMFPEGEPSPSALEGFVERQADEHENADADQQRPQSLTGRIEQAEFAIETQDLDESGLFHSLGLLHRDDTAFFVGILTRIPFADAEIYVYIFATTLVGDQIVNLQLTAPYEGRRTIETLLAQQRVNIQRLIAAN